MKQLSVLIIISLAFFACKQDKTENVLTNLSAAEQLLAESIAFHDPNGNWEKLETKIAKTLKYQ